MRRYTLIPLLCLIGAAVGARMPAFAQQEDPCARSAPAGSMLYVSVDTQAFQTFWEQVKDSAVVKSLLQAAGRGGKAPMADAGAQALLKMLNQAFSGRVGIALSEDAIGPGKIPSVALILPIKGQEEAKGLITLLKMQLEAQKVRMTTRDYQGTAIVTATGENLKGAQPSYAVLADRVLIASQPAWLEKAIDATAGRAQGLAANPSFERVRARVAAMGPAAGWTWMDTAKLNERIMEVMTQVSGAGAAGGEPQPGGGLESGPPKRPGTPFDANMMNIMKQMMGAYVGTGGRFGLTPQGVGFEGIALIDANHPFGRKLLTQQGGPLRSAALTSGNAMLYVAMNNLPLMVDVYSTIFAAMGPEVQKGLEGFAAGFAQATGLSLKKDVLDFIGAEVALVVNDLPPDLKSIPVMFYVQTTNRAGLGKSMQTLRTRLSTTGPKVQFVQKDLPEGRIYYIDTKGAPVPVAPGWTFAGDFMVIGLSPDAMRSPLFLAAGKGTSMAASQGYQQAVGARGDRLVSAFFINLAKVAVFADKLPVPKGKAGGPEEAAFKKALSALRTLAVVSTVEPDALTFRMGLSFDLTK